MEDVRDAIFAGIKNLTYTAVLTCERLGCISGVDEALKHACDIGCELKMTKREGEKAGLGEVIAALRATPKQMAIAEERIIGDMAKFSGIATAAGEASKLASGKLRIVSGSWKKMPPAIKDGVRTAVLSGGVSARICDEPMIYLDKNYIRMLGSIPLALTAAKGFSSHVKVVQIRGESFSVEEETVQAVKNGADILMVDTGDAEDLLRCSREALKTGGRSNIRLAFAGNVRIKDIPRYLPLDLDILCIGKDIVDASLLDMKLDVLSHETETRVWA